MSGCFTKRPRHAGWRRTRWKGCRCFSSAPSHKAWATWIIRLFSSSSILRPVVPRLPKRLPPNSAVPFHLFIEDRRWTRILGSIQRRREERRWARPEELFSGVPGLYGRPSCSFLVEALTDAEDSKQNDRPARLRSADR